MLIWFLILAIATISVVCSFSGLWRSVKSGGNAVGELDKSLYRARISEIDADFELGRIDEEAREAAKAEQARKLLKTAHVKSADSQMSASGTFAFIAVSMIFVPVFSLFLYTSYGSPEAANPILAKQENTQPAQTQASLPELLAVAEKRLVEAPDDVRGWRVVAPVYMRLAEFEKAANAFRNVLRLDGETPEVLLALGEALVLQHNNEVKDEAFGIFQGLQQQQPENARAAYFVALGEFQRGNAENARAIWQAMMGKSSGTEPWLQVVQDHLRQLETASRPTSGFTEEQREQINQMVSGLAERLEDEPQDREGWERLVRSYMVLERPDEARSAIEKARAYFNDDLQFITGLEKMVTEFPSVGSAQ
ncbi:MAG: c-type cytochrome biogenesis protein CcmI [Pseudomonadota bacterium]